MAVIGTGQQTIFDMNDVVASASQPSNPIDGQLWWNTTEKKLYVYSSTTGWKFSADGMIVGGRNILLGTTIPKSLLGTNTANQTTTLYDFVGGSSSQIYGKNIVVSFDWTVTGNASPTGTFRLQTGNPNWQPISDVITISSSALSGHFSKVYSVANTGGATPRTELRLDNIPTNTTITISNMQIELGNIESNWSPAPEDTQTSIDNINATLGNMANDNLLDYNERKVVKDKLTDIIGYIIADSTTTMPTTSTLDGGLSGKGSFYFVRKNATMAGLLTSDTRYVAVATQYDNLRTYLEGLTPIDAWDLRTATQSTNITVVKDTFRDKWMKYYQAELDLANATADQLKKNVDNVVTGGANWAVNGNFITNDLTKGLWTSYYVGQTKTIVDISSDEPPFKYAFYGKNTTNANAGIFTPPIWTGKVAEAMVGKEVTVSFWLKYQNIVQGTQTYQLGRFGEIIIEGVQADGLTKVSTYTRVTPLNGFNTNTASYFTGTNTTWQKYYGTVKLDLPAGAVKITNIYFKHGLEACTGEFWTTGIQIEIGNKVSDWKQSDLDINDRFTNVEFKVTPDQIYSSISASDIYNATLSAELGDWGFEQGATLWYQDHSLTTKLTGVTSVNNATGASGKVIQVTGEKQIFYGRKIPVDTSRTYKVTFRVRQTIDGGVASTNKIFAGVACYDINKNPLTQGTAPLIHRYVAIDSKDIAGVNTFIEYSGKITGEANNNQSEFIPGTKYVTPVCLVNYSGGTGTVQIDTLKFEDITELNALDVTVSDVVSKLDKDGLTIEIQKTSFYKNLYGGKNDDGSPVEGDLSALAPKSELENYVPTEDFKNFTGDSTGKSLNTLTNDFINNQINNENSPLNSQYATNTSLQATADGILGKFSASGGMNLLKNSIGFAPIIAKSSADGGTKGWFSQGILSRATTLQSSELDTLGFGSGFQFSLSTATQNTTIDQYVNVVAGKSYTLSWYLNKKNNTPSTQDGQFKIFAYEYGTTTLVPMTWKDSSGNIQTGTEYIYAGNYATTGYEPGTFTFVPTTNKIHVRFYAFGQCEAIVTGIMLTIGDVPLQWTLAYGESYNTNVRMDLSGIRVSQINGTKEVGYTQISPQEFAGYYDSDSNGTFEKVFYLNQDETTTKKLVALNEITLGTIKILRIPSQDAWKPSTLYKVGEQVSTGTNIYECTVGGTSGGTTPTHTSGTATDGSVTWQFKSAITNTGWAFVSTT